jgi:hypothetical protein
MQHTASLVQIAASRRSPALVAGVGAAFVASAITLSVMMSGAAPATAPQQAADGSKNQCRLVHRAMLAGTTGGGGTIRLREGDYISPPIVLGPRAQLVNFPLPRPGITPAEDVVVIEGNATDVVRTENSDPGIAVMESA